MMVTVALTFDLKFNRDNLHSDTLVCAKFDEPRSILSSYLHKVWSMYKHVDGYCDLDL